MPCITVAPVAFIPAMASMNESAVGSTAGFTSTMPATSGWRAASHAVMVPPIDSPATTMLRQRLCRSENAASAAPDQSSHRVSSMSSTVVPWPGRSGNSTVKPAAAKASASGRIDWQLPVKPCTTSTPSGPPAAEKGSAPGMMEGLASGTAATFRLDVRIFGAERLFPPVIGRWLPLRVLVDAVDGAHRRKALPAARAELGQDDDVHPVVEDGAKLRRAMAQTRVAVDAFRHLDPERDVLPLRVPDPIGNSLRPVRS